MTNEKIKYKAPTDHHIDAGTILIATADLFMKDGSGQALKKGCEYPIINITLREEIVIKSETEEHHFFDLDKKSDSYFGKWLDVKA